MASVVNNTYNLPSGRTNLVLGQVLGPAWSTDLVTNQWKSIAGTNFVTNITPLVPTPTSGSYWGSNRIDGILDAYCDPIPDLANDCLYYFGGGHTNSSINGIYKLTLTTMQYSTVLAPTDPAFYPPDYAGGWHSGITVTYPSGLVLGSGYFGIASELPDSRDTPYAANWRAPNARHTYSSFQIGNDGKIRNFYGAYLEFDTVSKAWVWLQPDIIGPLLYAQGSQYGNVPIGEGTTTVYDPVTNKYLFTMTPGSGGNNWRVGIVLFDPVTRTFDTFRQGGSYSGYGSASVAVAGRWAYCLNTDGLSNAVNGWRFNFDTKVTEWIAVQGDQISASGSQMEVIPICYHSGRNTLVRWNYGSDRSALYEVNLTPVGGGDGSSTSSRKLFQQTRIPLTGTAPSSVILNYQRMYYHAAANAIVFQPAANQNVFAVRI